MCGCLCSAMASQQQDTTTPTTPPTAMNPSDFLAMVRRLEQRSHHPDYLGGARPTPEKNNDEAAARAARATAHRQLCGRGRNGAAVLIQSVARRRAGSARVSARRRQVATATAQAKATAIVVRVADGRGGGGVPACLAVKLDALSRTIDRVVYVERRVPFVCAAALDVYMPLRRVLHYAPGFTLSVSPVNVCVVVGVCCCSARRAVC